MPYWFQAVLFVALAFGAAIAGVLGALSSEGIEAPIESLTGRIWLYGGGGVAAGFLIAALVAIKRAIW